MLTGHRAPFAATVPVKTHLRATVWGPAEFAGLPPRQLVAEGVLIGTLSVGAVVGVTFVGAWTGMPVLANGEAGLVCAAAPLIHLVTVRAGRALVGIAAVLAVCLALHAPQAAAGVVLSARGQVQSGVVTSVEARPDHADPRGRYLCSVMARDGTLLRVRFWRGCGRNTRPGDALAVVSDPHGLVLPRGLGSPDGVRRALWELAGWAGALLATCVIAVVRSFRMPPLPAETVSR
ncbi:hypothetical protein [Streptomyces sp. NPDC004783]|uniref:hypothetical protein n=1 Tax=Streptomyces sp. NPDC004783 TaxID=3154459 RepID=UPI0033AC42FC